MSAIRFDHVVKRFPAADGGETLAIDGLSFTVAEGDYVAILGRSGCGKSTTLSLVLGLIGASEGSVEVLGVDPHRDFDALRGRIGCVFQDDRLLPWRSAIDNVALPLEIAGIAVAERNARAAAWLDRLGLAGFHDAFPGMLSGGMRQRVAIARALVADPPLLLADEAFSSLDVATGRRLREELRAIATSSGKTVLHITHAIDEALDAADRILVLGRPGRCLAVLEGVSIATPARRAVMRRTILALIEGSEADGAGEAAPDYADLPSLAAAE
jgi:NitT/TauT family transport system ATP-binding protein